VGIRVVDETWNRAAPAESRRSTLVHLPFLDSDAALVASLRARERAGGAALYDRHHGYVRRVLTRVLGPDADLHDLIQDVFVAAIDSIDRLVDPQALRPWLAAISVNCARVELRRRTKSRLVLLWPQNELPETAAPATTPELDEAVRATYRVLTALPVDERIPFALRFIEGMDLAEVAQACEVSLATIKRRLMSAQKKFGKIASTYPELSDWVRGAAS
jgi:RNA polymerase sigma-70 factor (ECF subfamily)